MALAVLAAFLAPCLTACGKTCCPSCRHEPAISMAAPAAAISIGLPDSAGVWTPVAAELPAPVVAHLAARLEFRGSPPVARACPPILKI